MNLHVAYTQAGRLLSVQTVLGEDALLLERLEVEEGLNQLFTIRATVRAQTEEVRADSIVGTSADVALTLSDGTQRVWNGLVTELHEGPIVTRGARQYALTLRPRLWLMSQRSDCRIFLTQSTLQVIETLCSEHGIADYNFSGVTCPVIKLDYVVQWNESDLAYLLRRMQESGLFFYFAHAPGKHTFVVGDHTYAYRDSEPDQVRIAFGSSDGEHIYDWRRQLSFTPGRRASSDYEFTTPNTKLDTTTPSLIKVPGNVNYELYEYPGRFLSPEAGETATKLRIQATETDFDRIQGRSSVRTLAAGHRFTPYEVAHPEHAYDPQVVASILHRAEDPTYETGAGSPHYENEFEVMPAAIPATPHRTTPRPRIDGLQIAKVAGPAGEEIHTDQFGRVKLTFAWDRRAKADGTDTGWVRVSQTWGGGTWGQQIIPRIGMEALIAFQEGDPDRPIVVGIVPNPNNPVPYDLPANKTRTVMRSNSYKSKGFNEMTFEDATGGENLFTHAQKDHTTRVLNTRTKRVDAHEVASIGANRAVEVGGNQKHEIGGSMNLTVGGTGEGALDALSGVMGLASRTATLLRQAGAVAGSGGGGLAAFGLTLGQMALGFLSSGGLSARKGMVSGPNPRSDAGANLASSGQGIGGDMGGAFPMAGIMNTIVQSFQSTSVGIAQVEQIGISKVSNIGQSFVQAVGKVKQTLVGGRYEITVDEVIFSRTAKHIIVGSEKIVLAAPGGVIEINKEGIFIQGKRVEIKGEKIEFKKGSDGCTANSSFMKE